MMMYDRKILFDGLRTFGKLDGVQVSVIAAIVDEFERRRLSDGRWLAYMLATAWGECRWKPVREIGRGKGRPYGKPGFNNNVYYGRGLVQLTWQKNYELMSKRLNLPLVADPDMALLVPVAVSIMFTGMIEGLFTGKKLADYFSATVNDSVNARRIVNGTDKAKTFAKWHGQILTVLKSAMRDAREPSYRTDDPDGDAPITKAETAKTGAAGGAVVVGGGAAAAVAAGFDWKLVAMIAGCLVAVAVIGWFIVKLRAEA